jgi:hypothetical protein
MILLQSVRLGFFFSLHLWRTTCRPSNFKKKSDNASPTKTDDVSFDIAQNLVVVVGGKFELIPKNLF